MKTIIIFILSCLFLHAKPIVTVSILPQKFFVEQIAKDSVEVNVMVSLGESPATYEPKPKQMKELSKSDIYFTIGVPYERVWIEKFRLMYPKLNFISTDKNITKQFLADHHHGENHNHAKTHGDRDKTHSHEAIHAKNDHFKQFHDKTHNFSNKLHSHADPHIWLDPVLVKIQAKHIADALSKMYPEKKAFFEKNLNEFEKRLEVLHLKLKNILKNAKNKTFLVYHPSWGYFATRYDLVQEAIEIEGKEPKIADLKQIIEKAKKENIKTIFVAPQFSQKSAKLIASQINGNVVFADALSEDYELELLKTAAVLIK